VTSTTLSAPRRAALAVALALLIAAPAAADVVRWSHLDSTVSARHASGPSTWVTGTNVKRTSDLAQESWWGTDSSWNRYAYVENNPVNASDPTGELAMLGTALIGGLVDFSFQVAINAMEGKTGGELLEGTGKAFVRGAIIGATGYGLARVGGRVLEIGQGMRQARRAHAAGSGVDRGWKMLIEGKAHGTGAHRIRTYREAIGMAKSGRYDKIYINKSLKTATSGRVQSRLRPDVAGVRPGGLIDVIEVPSPSQTSGQMLDKVRHMESLLGDFAGPGSGISVIR
jgi:hypothetical protein